MKVVKGRYTMTTNVNTMIGKYIEMNLTPDEHVAFRTVAKTVYNLSKELRERGEAWEAKNCQEIINVCDTIARDITYLQNITWCFDEEW